MEDKTTYYIPVHCEICDCKLSEDSDSLFYICSDCANRGTIPFGMEGVTEIFSHWKKYEEHLDDYGIYFRYKFRNKSYYIDLPKGVCSTFYKMKSAICLALHLYPKKHTHDSVYLDFWGGSDYWGEYYEQGYAVGRGIFKNWWITEI